MLREALSLVAAVFLFQCTLSRSAQLTLDLRHKQPHSLTVNWTIQDGGNVSVREYRVSVDSLAPGEYHITYSGNKFINTQKNEAVISVHDADASYNVCITAVTESDGELSDCLHARTIKPVRTSSLVALVIVVGFFVLCVLAGAIAWKCATTSRGKPHASLDYLKTDAHGNGDTVHLTRETSSSIEA